MRRCAPFMALLVAGCLQGDLDLRGPGGVLNTGDGHDGDLTLTTGGETLAPDCVSVVSATGTAVELAQPAFEQGRVILIIQMQDDLGLSSGDTSDLTDIGDAGLWNLRRITVLAGTSATVGEPLTESFDSNGVRAAQACPVMEYNNVSLDGGTRLRAPPWDGAQGGVVAFLARGTVLVQNFQERIDANGRGFRGGAPSQLGTVDSITSLDTALDEGGKKGEGLDATGWDGQGRGNFGTGGGGGNALQAGGGGGSHVGAGGLGGKQNASVGDVPDTAGLGGAAVLQTDRLLFGGGGGGGHLGSGAAGGGGDGGGIVFIIAEEIVGSGSIRATGSSGGDAGNGTNPDGAGGGGAGGTVYIQTNDGNGFTGSLRADGANGGSVDGPAGDAERSGPGGGGGGGCIVAPGFVNASSDVTGGQAGDNTNANNNRSWGATSGVDGVAILE